MHLKSDIRGITLVELIVAVSLLTIVLSSAYFLLISATKSLKYTEAQFDAQESARIAVDSMKEDIRRAEAAYYSGNAHKAVEVSGSGMQITVHTDTDKDGNPEIVIYKLEDDQLKRGVAELGASPTQWQILIKSMKNNQVSPVVPIFSTSYETVSINLLVADEKDYLAEEPVNIITMVSVRSKGAMD